MVTYEGEVYLPPNETYRTWLFWLYTVSRGKLPKNSIKAESIPKSTIKPLEKVNPGLTIAIALTDDRYEKTIPLGPEPNSG